MKIQVENYVKLVLYRKEQVGSPEEGKLSSTSIIQPYGPNQKLLSAEAATAMLLRENVYGVAKSYKAELIHINGHKKSVRELTPWRKER